MKIGIIADTHDNLPLIKRAVEVLNKENIELLIHAGDFVAPFTFNELKNINCKFLGIFGNNDGDKAMLREKFSPIGEIKYPPYILIISNKRILIIHDPVNLSKYLEHKIYSIVIYAHTHQPEIKKEGDVLLVNPGECSGWLHDNPTVAIVDLLTMEANIINI